MASNFQISEAEWVEELAELSRAKDVFARIRWSFGHVIATECRPLVNERRLHLVQKPKSPSDSRLNVLQVYLPEPGYGRYEKRMNEHREVVLSIYHLPDPSKPDEYVTETHVTTSLDFVFGAGFDIRLQ